MNVLPFIYHYIRYAIDYFSFLYNGHFFSLNESQTMSQAVDHSKEQKHASSKFHALSFVFNVAVLCEISYGFAVIKIWEQNWTYSEQLNLVSNNLKYSVWILYNSFGDVLYISLLTSLNVQLSFFLRLLRFFANSPLVY